MPSYPFPQRPEMSQPADTAVKEFLQLYGSEAWLDWQRLLAHFDFGEGSSLLVLLLPGAVGADICRRHLTAHLAAKGQRLAELPCDWRNDARTLADRLFNLPVSDDLGGIWMGSVIPESDAEIIRWKDAWRHGLATLNQQRNPLLRRFNCPLVLVGAPWLNPLLREIAPDLWSVRAAVVMVTAAPDASGSHLSLAGEGNRLIESESFSKLTQSGESTDDPDYALERAERLRDRPEMAVTRARLLLRAGVGFQERARYESAERCLRDAVELLQAVSSQNLEPFILKAAAYNNLANVLGELGRLEEAQAIAKEGVQLYHKLAREQPDSFLPGLAGSLNNLANRLSALGRREEALVHAEESVRLHRQLARERPDAFLADLAMSLNNLSHMLSALGRREEALVQAEESVRLYYQLAQLNSDVFLPNLAASKNNLANVLSELSRREEALAQVEGAVRLRRQLALAQPDIFLSDLAASLNNIATMLSDLGRHDEALLKAKEAVRLYGELAQARPDAFLPNLAGSVNNLANRLKDLGRAEEALAQAEEAVRLRQQLARVHPDAFLADLATSFGARGVILNRMQKYPEAATSFAEGIQTLTPLFLKIPAAFADLIGRLIENYIQVCELGKVEVDKNLLAPVQEVYQKLNLNPAKEK